MRGAVSSLALHIASLACSFVGACGFSLTGAGGTPSTDAAADAPPADGPCTTFSSFIDTCELPAGDTLELVGNHTFDTDAGTLVTATGTAVPVETATIVLARNGIDVQAIFVDDLRLDGTLRAIGSRPFAIIARGDVTLVGTAQIEVGMGGAGAQTACANAAGDGEDDDHGGAGGGGGGLGAAGGKGGNGDSDQGQSDGAEGGPAIDPPSAIIGGCAGGQGGDGGEPGGLGGAGGGAVFVVAAHDLTIGATAGINAGGAGGAGGTRTSGGPGDAGGGGGGSGGTILLEAARVRNDGTLSANGGGGGEGSNNAGSTGRAGTDATLGTAPAAGGDGNSGGGAGGGPGGNSTSPNGGSVTVVPSGGGGGGGGAVGFIRIVAPSITPGSKVSPTPLP